MIHLVYTSRATTPLAQADLLDLLRIARANNAAAAITGVLLYHQERFFQVLEGPDAAVHARFRRIEADPRHTDMVVRLVDTTPERRFAAWSMGFVPTDILPPDVQQSFVAVLTTPTAANALLPSQSVIRVLLKAFALAASAQHPA